MNTTLQAIHSLLLAQHAALAAKLGNETDPAVAQITLTEMQEVLHRIELVQKLLFTASVAKLDKMLPAIKAANQALTGAINERNKPADFIKAVARFLTFVDKAIDLAKTVAAVAG